ncbi:MAG TPA: hypothetical protein VFX49_16470 [Chloroflexota bacterium]|nr:hypothetical protein [Chloroflexota bacterium]
MSITRLGARCQEHPHRVLAEGWGGRREREPWEEAPPGEGLGPDEPKCDRCAQPFCHECLTPTERFTDGTRHWFCPRCHVLFRQEQERAARERSLAYRAARAAARTRALVTGGVAIATLIALTGAAVFVTTRLLARGQPTRAGAQLAATCGELTRIRSVGAIGTQAAEDALNVLTYPRRAAVTLDVPRPGSAADASTQPTRQRGAPELLVDECDTGWLLSEPVQLPLTFTLTLEKAGAYAQRIALWQDPGAPRESWVRDFEVLFSPTASGEDFAPIMLDRAAQLKETVEPQWFEVSRPGPGAVPRLFPEALPAQRLRLRVLTTHSSPRPRSVADGIALGEVALYGPDLEMIVRNVVDGFSGAEYPDAFEFVPGTISALAGRPKFVLVYNRSKSATHIFATSGQQQNGEVEIPPGEARSLQFVAAGRPGRYEYFCKVPGHAARGLIGRIEVR